MYVLSPNYRIEHEKEYNLYVGNSSQSLLDNQWIEVNTAKEQKKGSIKYSTPEFTLGKNLTAKESGMADSSAESLK